MEQLTGPQTPEDRFPLIDLETGQGVSDGEIQRWKAAAKRFDIYSYQNNEKIDTSTFPRPQRTKDFFKGESEYSYRDGKLNPVNNPLRLIRPATLHSVGSFFEENGQTYGSPVYDAKDRSERGLGDNMIRKIII